MRFTLTYDRTVSIVPSTSVYTIESESPVHLPFSFEDYARIWTKVIGRSFIEDAGTAAHSHSRNIQVQLIRIESGIINTVRKPFCDALAAAYEEHMRA